MAAAEQAVSFPISFVAFNRLTAGQKLGTILVLALAIAILVGDVYKRQDWHMVKK